MPDSNKHQNRCKSAENQYSKNYYIDVESGHVSRKKTKF